MQFNSVRAAAGIGEARPQPAAIGAASRLPAGIGATGQRPAGMEPPADIGAAAEAPAPPQQAAAAPAGQQLLVEGSKNLLKHIPGEASGFYLIAVDSIHDPGLGTLTLIFVLAFVLLVVVRWLAGASRGIMVTTIIAFALWMFILDKGLLHVAFPSFLPDPLGLIVAVFYSTLITILASAGRIR